MFSVQQITSFINQIRYMQYLTTVLATLPAASYGMHVVWPSPSLPKLTSMSSPIGITISVEEASWVVSSAKLGSLCAAFFKIFYTELFGPKIWLLIAGIFLVIPGLMIYFSKLVLLLYIARFTSGIGSALVFTTVPVYIAEIAEKDIRGKLALSVGILALCGNVFVLTIGPFVSYHNLALYCVILPLAFLILFSFMPESPYYLVKIGRKDAAMQTLTLLSSKSTDDIFINKRLQEIEETVTYDMNSKSNIWEFISSKKHRKTLVIMLGTKGLLQMSGIQVIDAYAQTIIEKAHSSISPELSSLLFGIIQFPAVFFASFLVDRAGRKPLWIFSAVGCATALFGEGLYFYLHKTDSIGWLPTTCLLIFFVVCPIGVTTLPYVTVGEIFSTDIKGAAVSLSVLYSSALSFIVLKFFEPVAEQFGVHVLFWTFAGSCVLGVCFILLFLPETKGKTLEEIQKMLNKNRK